MRIEIHFLFVAMIALCTLVDETQIAFLGLVSSLLHESGHILAFVLLGFKVEKLSFEVNGIALKKANCVMSITEEIIVTLAGCAVNMIIFMIGIVNSKGELDKIGIFPVINLIVCSINLLPMPALDGGQALSLILGKLCTINFCQRVCFVVQILIIAFFMLISITTICLGKINFSFLILTVYLIFMVLTS